MRLMLKNSNFVIFSLLFLFFEIFISSKNTFAATKYTITNLEAIKGPAEQRLLVRSLGYDPDQPEHLRPITTPRLGQVIQLLHKESQDQLGQSAVFLIKTAKEFDNDLDFTDYFEVFSPMRYILFIVAKDMEGKYFAMSAYSPTKYWRLTLEEE